MKLVFIDQISFELYSGCTFRERFVFNSFLVERCFSWAMDWKLALLYICHIFSLNHSASLARQWGSLSYHVCAMVYRHWVWLLSAFWCNHFSNVLHLFTWASLLASIRTRFLSSYRNLVSFLFSIIWLIQTRSIQRLFIDWSFFVNLVFQVFIDRIILDSCVSVCMVLFDNIIEKLLNGVWAFGIEVFGFFHLFHLKVHFLDKACEFVLISFFICIKLEDSLL